MKIGNLENTGLQLKKRLAKKELCDWHKPIDKTPVFGLICTLHFGAMAERLKAAVLKTVVLRGTGGSNPSRSAIVCDCTNSGVVRERSNRAPC